MLTLVVFLGLEGHYVFVLDSFSHHSSHIQHLLAKDYLLGRLFMYLLYTYVVVVFFLFVCMDTTYVIGKYVAATSRNGSGTGYVYNR